MEEKRCAHCGCLLDLNPRSNNQRYCGKKECQRARKRVGKDGLLRVISQQIRSQVENNELTIERFAELLRDA